MHGAETHRVCFNKGDLHFAKADFIHCYHGEPAAWGPWLAELIAGSGISAVACYGDSRFYHREAKTVCDQMGLAFFAFEEGYVRPGYVTFEKGGNNANSLFPAEFAGGSLDVKEPVPPARIPGAFRFQFWFATLYYMVKDWRLGGFRGYLHHRRGSWATEMMAWLRAGFRKNLVTRWRDKGMAEKLIQRHGGRLYLVPLQVAVDSQMIYHSDFESVDAFIEACVRSFAEQASADSHLFIKHHPMDRGFTHYGALINKLGRQYGIGDRVTYAFDADLEALFPHLAGCVVVNSTVGLQALEAGVPTIALGKSMIGHAGLTEGSSLDAFWQAGATVDTNAVARFKRQLIAHTLIPGSFYRDRQVAARAAAEAMLA